MNLWHCADTVMLDRAGGAQTVAWELARCLSQRAQNIAFLVARLESGSPRDEMRQGVRLIRYPGAGRPGQYVWHGRQAARHLATEARPDLVHSHFAYADLGPSMGIPIRTPWVRSFYGPWDEEGWTEDTIGRTGWLPRARLKKWIRRRIERRSLHRAARVIVLSAFSREQAVALGVKPERIRLAPAGSNLTRFHPAGSRRDARARLGIPFTGPLLLTVRRLVERMGLKSLVRAMASVVQTLPEARLIIGGRGPEREALENLIRELGLEDHVHLSGFIEDDRLADYYRAADLFVLPTAALEGFGLVTVDALACGTPVLGTPVGATPEILGSLDPRLLTAGIAPDHLVEGILRFWNEDWRSGLTPQRLHSYVSQRFTWKAHTDVVLKTYEEAIEEQH